MSKGLLKKALCALFVCALLFASAAQAAEFPEKAQSVYVYDEAGVITAETEEDINDRADALFAMTGAQIITVCIDSTGDTPINEYASALFNEWQIGSPQRDNGLLCVMAIDDREYWLLQGNGIKNDITNGQLQVINNDYLEEYFAREQYDEGAKSVFDQLLLKFEALYSIDIDNWDGQYIDFTYTEPPAETTAAPAEKEPFKFMDFLTVFLWVAAGVVLVIVIITSVSIFRRPRFVSGGYFRRRTSKGTKGPYLGLSPQISQKPASRNQSQRRAGHPAQDPRRRMSQQGTQRPVNGSSRPTQQGRQNISQNPGNVRRPNTGDPRQRQRQAKDTTVYPDNPPYINGPGSNPNQRNGGMR